MGLGTKINKGLESKGVWEKIREAAKLKEAKRSTAPAKSLSAWEVRAHPYATSILIGTGLLGAGGGLYVAKRMGGGILKYAGFALLGTLALVIPAFYS